MGQGVGLDIGIIAVYSLAILAFGLRTSRRVHSVEDYTVAGRKLGFTVLVGTLVMTELNPSTMAWLSSFSYRAGWQAAALLSIFVTGLGGYALLVAGRWKRLGAVSIAEMFEQRYSPAFRRIVSAATILVLMLFSGGYLIAVTKTVSSGLQLPAQGAFLPGLIAADSTLVYTALLVTSVVLVFTLAGGLVSVALTDTVSLFLTVLGVAALAAAALTMVPISSAAASYVPPSADSGLSLGFLVTLNAVILFVYPLSPWYGQRMFAAKSEAVATRAVFAACVVTVVLYAGIQISTFCYHAVDQGLNDPDNALGRAINVFLKPGLRGLLLATIFAICQTTMSSIWNVTASMVVQDYYKGWLRPAASDKQQLAAGRLATAVVAAVTLVLGTTMSGESLVVINLLGNTLFAAMFFPCVFGFLWWRASTRAAWTTLVVGWLAGSSIALYANVFAEPPVHFEIWSRWVYLYLAPAVCVLGVVLSVVLPPAAGEVEQRARFFAKVGAPWVGKRNYLAQCSALTGRPSL